MNDLARGAILKSSRNPSLTYPGERGNMLNKTKGNMYDWINYTWNPVKGKCFHDCEYCYMKHFTLGDLRLDEKCLNDDLGVENKIFIGSSTDMFADSVPFEWIAKVLDKCRKHEQNTYVFQSKNPARYMHFEGLYPESCIFGTTIETNRHIKKSLAPESVDRLYGMRWARKQYTVFISMEPIMAFDLEIVLGWMKELKPNFISIGADSKNHNLPEPLIEEIKTLINHLELFTIVKLKNNLNRLKK